MKKIYYRAVNRHMSGVRYYTTPSITFCQTTYVAGVMMFLLFRNHTGSS
jgi:hypothetical protein